jgi:hypothetical protein
VERAVTVALLAAVVLAIVVAAAGPGCGCCGNAARPRRPAHPTNGPSTSAATNEEGPGSEDCTLTWGFVMERMTGIEPAYSAWEPDCSSRYGR